MALRSRVLSPMVVMAFRQVPLARRPKLALDHFPWAGIPVAEGDSTQAPRYLDPQATHEGPNGPKAIAWRHSWCLCWGTTTDLTVQLQGPHRT